MNSRRWLSAIVILVLSLAACSDPKNVVLGVQAPLRVNNGDKFVITASVENTAPETQTLVSLDIGDAYLEGIAILRTEPDNKQASHVPIDDTMSYEFDLPVEAGGRIEIKLFAEAVQAGDHNSHIDFCINSEYLFLTKPLRTIVK